VAIKPFNIRHTPAIVLAKEFENAIAGKLFKITRYTWNDHTGIDPKHYIKIHYGDEFELRATSESHYLFYRKVLPAINIRLFPDDFVFIKSVNDIMKFRVDKIDRGSKKVYLINDLNPLIKVIYHSKVSPPIFDDGQVINMGAKFKTQRWYIYRFMQEYERTYQMHLLQYEWQSVVKAFKKELESAEKMLTHRQKFTKCFEVMSLLKEFNDRMYSIRRTSPIPEFISNGKRNNKTAKRNPLEPIEADQMGGLDI